MNFIILLVIVFFFVAFISYKIGKKVGAFKKDIWWKNKLPSYRKDAILKSRKVLSGNFSEQLAPFLPGFNYSPTECKFLGKPVDFLVFEGMDEGKIKGVTFVEVKSGKSKLNKREKSLKEAIKNKKVKWGEYRVPSDLTEIDDSFFP
jgi:predicted Holliday junction resolvase-like endonuclease